MRRAFFIALLFLSQTLIAQNESVVGYFTSTELNGKVLLTWNIKQGNTCNGVKVEHSTDSLNFTEIGSIEGVCGSNTANTPYEFTHQDPAENAVNYYRLLMGGVGYSWVISEKVIAIDEPGYTLAPNPVTTKSVLYFENGNSKAFDFNVFNAKGSRVYSGVISSEEIQIGSLGLHSGMHYFELSDGSTTIRGKFLVP